MIKTKAAVLYEIGLPKPYSSSKPLKIEEVIIDEPGENELIVQVKAAGLCHSDLSSINGNRPRQTPMVLGHEAAGIVHQIGPGVNDLNIGDHVIMTFAPSCGKCSACMEGLPARCGPGQKANNDGTLLGGSVKLSINGEKCFHHVGVSAFSEYALVNRGTVVKVDKDLPFEEAALFGCAVLTGVGAALNTAKIHAGASVAVVGLGGVGLNALLGAKVAGATKIVAIDMNEDKFDIATELGATSTQKATNPNVIDNVKEYTNGGVDYALEMAGSVKAMELAYRITKRGGTTVTAGLPHPDHRWELQHTNLTAEERTVKGSYMGSCIPNRDVKKYIELYKSGLLNVNKLLSSKIKLEEINEAFDKLDAGKTIRQIITF
ncbi:MAG: zinc-dependent alcohol dehydrogenase family protein [Hydrogenophilales bacterium]